MGNVQRIQAILGCPVYTNRFHPLPHIDSRRTEHQPADSPRALGAIVSYGDGLLRPTQIGLCPKRVQTLLRQLAEARLTEHLPATVADSIHGKLMHASDQMFGSPEPKSVIRD